MQKLASRALAAGIAVALSGTAGAQVVISQVYPNAGANGYHADYVELHNTGNATVNLGGWSLQYAQQGSGWQRTQISGTLPPGGYYLIRMGTTTAGRALPTSNFSSPTSMAPQSGKLALLSGGGTLAQACPSAQAGLVDLFGYGATDCYEGSARAAVVSPLNAYLRKNDGCQDSQSNAADFSVASAAPRNAASARLVCAPTLPKLSVQPVAKAEGHSGVTPFEFELKLDAPAGPTGVDWSVHISGTGTATPDADYTPINLSGRIEPGQNSARFVLPVRGDSEVEADETVTLQIKVHAGATTANGDYLDTVATLLNDDTAPPPTMSVANVARSEGHDGYAPFEFELKLDRPAGAGGAQWRALSVDGGTATAGADYLPIDLAGTIAEGQSAARFALPVRGDTVPEANETVKLRIDLGAGARAADGSASLATEAVILDDDPLITPIHAIQGRGERSPMLGQQVQVEGIVTAIVKDGFFLQAPATEADADPLTSEALFVQTGTAPNPNLQALRVRAVGIVAELYAPGDQPDRASMTAIVATNPAQNVGNVRQPLPPALVRLQPDPGLGAAGYEAFEGMRVQLDDRLVIGATGGRTDAGLETTVSDGVFYLLDGAADAPPPMREPGARYGVRDNGAPAGWIPRWDGNPEAIGVDSAATGRAPFDVAVGARVGNAVGPLDQRSGRYTVIQQADQALLALAPAPAPSGVDAADPYRPPVDVAYYDLGAFHDEISPPNSGQPASQPFAVERRLDKLAEGIVGKLRLPHIVAIGGVENRALLERLAQRIDQRAATAGQANPNYRAVSLESDSPLQLGFLLRSDQVGPAPRVLLDGHVQIGCEETLALPSGDWMPLFEQAPQFVDATVRDNGAEFRLRVLLAALAPLDGSDADSAQGRALRSRRHAQADFLARWVQQHQQAAGALPLLVLGDLQGFGFGDGYTDPVGTLIGKPSDPLWTLVPGDGIDRVDPNLIALTATGADGERYSSIVEGSRQQLQHALADERLVAATDAIELRHARINAGQPATARNQAGSELRAANADPLHVRLLPRTHADLSLSVQAPQPPTAGQWLEYRVVVDNLGPDDAHGVGVGMALSQAFDRVRVQAPPDWNCGAPQIEAGRTSAACSAPRMWRDSGASLSLFVLTYADQAGTDLTLAASATAQSADPQPGNNAAQASARLTAAPAP
ncbi:lamin tail domain-containing protein [Lysobacter enzymogenes]|uniref:lamin tail domain-containing protein n=1 Tax=Lysobacter enzymogenes TaxID=69 RepID=UPI001AFC4345|nr:lamin tail domain-containing protein [Lysobacter enzymogenes]QQQ02299.1 lamin tail domain-containing protein [Lysobacter enzymogenes]